MKDIFKNKNVLYGAGALAIAGIYWYFHKKHELTEKNTASFIGADGTIQNTGVLSPISTISTLTPIKTPAVVPAQDTSNAVIPKPMFNWGSLANLTNSNLFASQSSLQTMNLLDDAQVQLQNGNIIGAQKDIALAKSNLGANISSTPVPILPNTSPIVYPTTTNVGTSTITPKPLIPITSPFGTFITGIKTTLTPKR